MEHKKQHKPNKPALEIDREGMDNLVAFFSLLLKVDRRLERQEAERSLLKDKGSGSSKAE